MPIYDVEGVHYDIDTTDTEVAKQKIREYQASQASDSELKQFGRSAAGLADTAAGAVSGTVGALAYPFARAGRSPEEAQRIVDENITKPMAQPFGRAFGVTQTPEYQGEASQRVMGAVAPVMQKGIGAVSDATGLPQQDVESYLNTLAMAAGPKVAGATNRGLGRLAGAEIDATNAVKGGAQAAAESVADTGRQVQRGYDYAVHNRGESAYKPVDPAVVELARKNKVITDRQADLINNRGTLLGEGEGVQGFTENLVSNYRNKPIQEMAFDVIPSLATGMPIPGGAIKEAIKAGLDTRAGGKIRGSQSPDIIRTPEGMMGSSPAVPQPTVNTPGAMIDTNTGAISPMDAAAMRRQQFEAENAAKLEQVRQQQAAQEQAANLERMNQAGVRSATPEELVQSNPLIQNIKQRAQAALPSTPKDLAMDTLSGASDPAVTAAAAQAKAKQMLAPEMRAQIEARVAAQKAAQQAKLQETMSAPAVPDQRGTYAPLPTIEDRLAALKQQDPNALRGPAGLFEGMPEETVGKGPTKADIQQITDEYNAKLTGNVDTSDMGKIFSEAQIRRKYEAYKNAINPTKKAKLKAEYDSMENARADRGLNAGGNPDVLQMQLGTEAPEPFVNKEQAQMLLALSKNPEQVFGQLPPHQQKLVLDLLKNELQKNPNNNAVKSILGTVSSNKGAPNVSRMMEGPVAPKFQATGTKEDPFSSKEEYTKANLFNTLAGKEQKGFYRDGKHLVKETIQDLGDTLHTYKDVYDSNGRKVKTLNKQISKTGEGLGGNKNSIYEGVDIKDVKPGETIRRSWGELDDRHASFGNGRYYYSETVKGPTNHENRATTHTWRDGKYQGHNKNGYGGVIPGTAKENRPHPLGDKWNEMPDFE